MERSQLIRWLCANDFVEAPGGMTSHRKFVHSSGHTITVPNHGRRDLSKKHTGMLVRKLREIGFSPTDLQMFRR